MRHKKHKSRISSAVKKRVCAALLVGVMGITMVAGASYVPSVYAKTDAEIKRDEYKDKLVTLPTKKRTGEIGMKEPFSVLMSIYIKEKPELPQAT